MAIAQGDIKLLKSEVMLDTDDGGGYMTANEIVDGVSNNMFPDISELDRTYGRVSLRKCYAAVLTTNTDSYYGVNAIVSKGPDDPNVSVTLFTTKSWSDRRDSARDRIETYLASGPRWAGHLLETQISGQRAIQIALRATDEQPKVGQGLVLVGDEGLTTQYEQYVRVTKISSVVRTFTVAISGNSMQEIDRTIVTIELSDPLRYTFKGPTVPQFETGATPVNTTFAVLRDTVVADAANYYGIRDMTKARAIGDTTVNAESIFAQLVPSAQAETALADLSAGTPLVLGLPAATTPIRLLTNGEIGPGKKLYLGSPIVPGSLKQEAGGSTLITDDSVGGLYQGSTQVGTVEYDKGVLTFNTNAPGVTGQIPSTFLPGANPIRLADTASIAIAQENRGYNYVLTLFPPPAPGSLTVSYMAQGKVYYLYDKGDGTFRGSDAAFGSGTINYATGTLILTCGALPDAGSEIIFAWGKAVSTFIRTNLAVPGVEIRLVVAKPNVAAGTVRISWGNGLTAQDDGAGKITGSALGTINYARGEIKMVPLNLPQVGSVFTVRYSNGEPLTMTIKPLRNTDGTVAATIQKKSGQIIPGTVEINWNLNVPDYDTIVSSDLGTPLASAPTGDDAEAFGYDVPDAGAGNGTGTGKWKRDGQIIGGNINYATGVLRFVSDVDTQVYAPSYAWVQSGEVSNITLLQGGQVQLGDGEKLNGRKIMRYQMTGWKFITAVASLPYDGVGELTIKWRETGGLSDNEETFTMGNLVFDLTFGYAESIIPGTVLFTLGNFAYIDRLGTLYHSVNNRTGAGTVGGRIAYDTGKVTLTDWSPNSENTVRVLGLATEATPAPVDQVVFRVPVAPVRPSSFQIRCVPLNGDGQSIMVSADSTGKIQHPGISGSIDYQTGTVRVFFKEKILVTPEVATKAWYDETLAYAEGQQKFFDKPAPVFADTIFYNAVGYTYLPLNADILGLDPVRLPSDGRVPVFRVGDTVVVHHTDTAQFPSPASGKTLNVGRTRVTNIRLVDSVGTYFADTMYTTDLDEGTITLNSTFSMSGKVAPVFAEHRIEDMALCSDVQINGDLQLTRTLTHAYPLGSKVSSALIIGDIQARAFNRFPQNSWTGAWSDSLIGTAPLSNYNGTQYPFVVTNKGSLQERWALIFTTSNDFRVVGEQVGQIAVGNINSDLAPINPATGVPYFEIKALGWGSGWAAGNVLRFNTAACNYPIWAARTVLQGSPSEIDDGFSLQIRGDIDR